MITSANTVVVPTRIGPQKGFRLIAYAGAGGTKKWTVSTDYTVPLGAVNEWPPPIPAGLLDDSRVAVAGAGGTLLIRSQVDDNDGPVHRVAFYGIDQWRALRAAYRRAVQITTPLTTGPAGSVYFGFSAAADAPDQLRACAAERRRHRLRRRRHRRARPSGRARQHDPQAGGPARAARPADAPTRGHLRVLVGDADGRTRR